MRATQSRDPSQGNIDGATAMTTEPLGLPKGSVRAAITLIVVVVTCGVAALKGTVPDVLGMAFGTVVASYFSARPKGGSPA